VYPIKLHRIAMHGQGLKNSLKRMPKRSHDDYDDDEERRGNGRGEKKKRSNF
jgi:hypothetical protein